MSAERLGAAGAVPGLPLPRRVGTRREPETEAGREFLALRPEKVIEWWPVAYIAVRAIEREAAERERDRLLAMPVMDAIRELVEAAALDPRRLAVAMAEEGFAVPSRNRDEQWDAPYEEAARIAARLASDRPVPDAASPAISSTSRPDAPR